MDEHRIARRVLMAEVSGGRIRGRPKLGRIIGVKVVLGSRGMTVGVVRQYTREWRALVHIYEHEL